MRNPSTKYLRFAAAALVAVTGSVGYAQATNTFPATGNAGIGTTNPGGNRLQIVGAVGSSDYTSFAQHNLQLRFLNGLGVGGTRALEIGLLDNGVSVIQSNEAGVGYNVLALNPVAGSVGVGTLAPSERLDVAGNIRARGMIYASDDGAAWWLYGTGNGPGIMLQKNASAGGPTARRGSLGWMDNNGGTWELVTWSGDSGFVGIGTANPAARLDVVGALRLGNATTESNYFATLTPSYDSTHPFSISVENNTGGHPVEVLGVYSPMGGGYVDLGLGLHGNVGIGTTAPTHKLSVNGAVRAKEVIVDTGWSDYVFADDYRLPALSEVERHIKAEKHLPGIPSAADVAKDGVSVGEMQAKLLAKVEELTLYVLELKQENDALKARVAAVENRKQTP